MFMLSKSESQKVRDAAKRIFEDNSTTGSTLYSYSGPGSICVELATTTLLAYEKRTADCP
jgi:hypothetical protein